MMIEHRLGGPSNLDSPSACARRHTYRGIFAGHQPGVVMDEVLEDRVDEVLEDRTPSKPFLLGPCVHPFL